MEAGHRRYALSGGVQYTLAKWALTQGLEALEHSSVAIRSMFGTFETVARNSAEEGRGVHPALRGALAVILLPHYLRKLNLRSWKNLGLTDSAAYRHWRSGFFLGFISLAILWSQNFIVEAA